MVLHRQRAPLSHEQVAEPKPSPHQVLIEVSVCGLCRTDLHVVDGELRDPKLPLICGHQVVGRAAAVGAEVQEIREGTRVGVPWLGWWDRTCVYCREGHENLCDHALFTGYTLDGGFASYMAADERACLALPDGYGDLHVAPLLCAGLIGYRSLRMAGDASRLGVFGFGASAHIVTQVAAYRGQRVFALTRPGDERAQEFARTMGAVWAGSTDQNPPEELDAAIIFAPAGELIPTALRMVRKGGVVVCAGIHMTDIPSFPYSLLWGERVLRSVANLTHADGVEFLKLAPEIPIHTEVEMFPLAQANEALSRLRAGDVRGAAVLEIGKPAST
ncbi:MAG TPA: zinc-dependent alcohol dehydrogenase family protein [Candidatus Dormibacteraeota bacterium]|nr:zinc-dependent alcohol dehydrogenase family protein [Candidatus Dormibacteraeota bacterium]